MENFLLQRELTISCSRTERGKHMQLGIRLHDIKKAPLEERLAIAKEQGFFYAVFGQEVNLKSGV